MKNANLYALLRQNFKRNPTKTALATLSGEIISYSLLDEMSASIAATLKAFGVVKGDRVAVQVEKSPKAVALYLGCLRLGAVYLPLNTAYTPPEVAYFIGDAGPVLLICDPKCDEALMEISDELGSICVLTMDYDGDGSFLRDCDWTEPLNFVENVKGGDLAAILYTSGTTGRSKGAMLSHKNLSTNVTALHNLWGWRENDVLIHALPIFHVHGLFVAIHCALLNGSKIWFLPKFDADQVIQLLPKSTVMMGVPTFYSRLIECPNLTPEVCINIRLFISGSAPLLEETFYIFEKKSGHRILERYGMTETGMITSNPLNGDRMPGTVGFPLPGVKVRIANNEGKPLNFEDIGVLETKGPNVFRGYWGMPEKTEEEFRDGGWFITGDIAKMSEDGRVSIIGRVKDMIISGGYNIYPKEIETVIDELDGINESAVIGLPHPDFGEAVVAIIDAEEGMSFDLDIIQNRIRSSLARFKLPKKIFTINQLPRNSMGKVQKNLLREEFKKTFS